MGPLVVSAWKFGASEPRRSLVLVSFEDVTKLSIIQERRCEGWLTAPGDLLVNPF